MGGGVRIVPEHPVIEQVWPAILGKILWKSPTLHPSPGALVVSIHLGAGEATLKIPGNIFLESSIPHVYL